MEDAGFGTIDDTGPPTPKKLKTSNGPVAPVSEVQPTRKGKACFNCRRMKVKCDLAERGSGSCSRCLRLSHQCVSKKTWARAENAEETQQQMSRLLFKLERAMEDVLEKLNMPALDLYAPTPVVEHVQSPRSTRHNSQEAEPNGGSKRREREVPPGPMRSLIEATRLDGLFSQLRSVKQRRRGGMRRMDSDLISEKVISYEQAERLFDTFKSLLSQHLFSATVLPEATLESVRTSSTVLFTAIMLVSAVHIPGYEQIHKTCHGRFLGLVYSAIFDRFHTLDDIRGLCIAAFWQPDLSWTLSGICIRMATELNLHHAFYEAFYTPDISDQARRDNLEKTRLWYLLFVLDHQSSIAYARPPVMATELRPIKDVEVFLKSPWCTPQDKALIAQVTGFVILSKAFETFGLEPKRTMGGDDASVLTHSRFTEDARAWRERWKHLAVVGLSNGDRDIVFSGKVDLHYYFSELVLHSLVLRGRPLDNLHNLPSSLRPLTLRAIEAAHSLLQHFLEEPDYCDGIVGMPLCFHSMIAFATVFLMKISHRWQAIGITIESGQRTQPLIKDIIELLRGCKAGANHMVFSMANGFERMLSQAPRQGQLQQTTPVATSMPERSQWPESPGAVRNRHRRADLQHGVVDNNSSTTTYADMVNSQQPFDPGAPLSDTSYTCPVQSTPDVLYEQWGFQDEELWNLGMGYDLLAPGGDGLMSADFPFLLHSNNWSDV